MARQCFLYRKQMAQVFFLSLFYLRRRALEGKRKSFDQLLLCFHFPHSIIFSVFFMRFLIPKKSLNTFFFLSSIWEGEPWKEKLLILHDSYSYFNRTFANFWLLVIVIPLQVKEIKWNVSNQSAFCKHTKEGMKWFVAGVGESNPGLLLAGQLL